MSLSTWPSEVARIPARDPSGHKGTFGRVLVVGGCAQHARVMVGGPALCAVAALRSGCGVVELAMPAPVLLAGLTIAPSAVGHSLEIDASGHVASRAIAALAASAEQADAVVCGPGLGGGAGDVVRAMLTWSKLLVLDADGLNALAADASLRAVLATRTSGATVLTPHVGEARTLARACGLAATASAVQLSQALGALVVLKSSDTAIAGGDRAWSVRAGTSALATAGSGDVLAGMVAGLWSQWPRSTAFEIACQSVCLHGLSSVRWSATHGRAGMLAMELASLIPDELERWRLGGAPAML